jgi:hypothetical protein
LVLLPENLNDLLLTGTHYLFPWSKLEATILKLIDQCALRIYHSSPVLDELNPDADLSIRAILCFAQPDLHRWVFTTSLRACCRSLLSPVVVDPINAAT